MIRRILDTLAVVAFVAFLPLLAVAQSGVSAISASPATPGNGSRTTCSVASAVWRTSSPAATLDCSSGLTYASGTLTAGVSGTPGIISSTFDGTAGNTFTMRASAISAATGILQVGTQKYISFGSEEASTPLLFAIQGSFNPWLKGGGSATTFFMSGGTTDFQFYNKAGTVKKWSIADTGGMVIGSADITGSVVAAQVVDSDGQALLSGVPDLALTDNTIATFAVQTLGNDTGGGGTFWYTVCARDATTFGCESGMADFVGGDATSGAGGEVCTNPVKHGTPPQALSGSTLTVTFAATTGTDLCNLRVTADTDIVTPTSLTIKWGVLNSGRTITPQ